MASGAACAPVLSERLSRRSVGRRYDIIVSNPPYVPAARDGDAAGRVPARAARSGSRRAPTASTSVRADARGAPRAPARRGGLLVVRSAIPSDASQQAWPDCHSLARVRARRRRRVPADARAGGDDTVATGALPAHDGRGAMSGNTFGTLFTVTTFGESHGPALGAIVDGCPPGLEITEAELMQDSSGAAPARRTSRASARSPTASASSPACSRGARPARRSACSSRTPTSVRATTRRSRTGSAPATRTTPTSRSTASATIAAAGGRPRATPSMRVAAGAIARKYLRERLGIESTATFAQLGPLELDPVEPPSCVRQSVLLSRIRRASRNSRTNVGGAQATATPSARA